MSQILEQYSPLAITQGMEKNFQASIEPLSLLMLEGEVRRNAYASWFLSGIPMSVLNSVMENQFTPETPAENIEATVKQITASATGLPLCWVIGPTLRELSVASYLQNYGWSKVATMPTLVLDMLMQDLSPRQYLAGLTVERVADETDLQQYIDTIGAGFHFSDFALSKMPRRPIRYDLLQDPTVYHYLARLHGEPVACSMLVLSGGVAGLYSIATFEHVRRRGIGRAITLATLLKAQSMGYRFAVLQASDDGFHLYQQLGFQEHCTFDMYVLPENVKQ
jgi:hypothetical protein